MMEHLSVRSRAAFFMRFRVEAKVVQASSKRDVLNSAADAVIIYSLSIIDCFSIKHHYLLSGHFFSTPCA